MRRALVPSVPPLTLTPYSYTALSSFLFGQNFLSILLLGHLLLLSSRISVSAQETVLSGSFSHSVLSLIVASYEHPLVSSILDSSREP